MQRVGSPSTVYDAAVVAKSRGFNIVPVHRGTKKPIEEGWQLKEFQPADFTGKESLGVHWNGHVVEVDLESNVAVEVWRAWGPKTEMRWGRPGKPESHWAYWVDEQPKYLEIKGPELIEGKATIIELRTQGHQTVMPPSPYSVDGDYEWNSEPWGDPGVVDADELVRLVKKTAVAVLLSQEWAGRRHNLSLGLGVWLSQQGWEQEEIEELVTVVNDVTGNPDNADSLQAVRDSVSKWQANGVDLKGYGYLEEGLEPKTLKKIVRILKATQAQRVGVQGALTDIWNGKWFAQQNRGRLLMCDPLGGWLTYNGRFWERVPGLGERRFAHEAVEAMYEYARGLPRAEADALVDHAYETESSKRLDSMVKEGTWRLMADPAMFDRHPLYLNVGNGTLNLETMELEEHRAEDYLTSGLSLEYDSGAECPRWLEFLDQIFGGDQELIDYMQKVLGYTLTGRVGEQCLFFLFGSGKNGKSTLIRVVAGIMESLAGVIEISALTHGKSDSGSNPSPSLVSLRDKRFVSSREADENRGFSEGLIKDLTGGDTITARALYKDNITFQPQFKLFIYGNSKPTIKGQDEGIWRRMRIIPFEVEIPVKDRIEDYDAILLEEEGPGILAWMVRGTQAWMKEKLVTPARVLSSIEEYREENDYMAMFIEERLEAAPGATIDRDTLYAEYQGWAGMAGERVLSKRLFITRMKEKNVDYRREQMGGDRVFAGYRLRK